MKKDNQSNMKNEDINSQNPGEDINAKNEEFAGGNQKNGTPENNMELECLKAQIDEKSKQCEEYLNSLQRVAAEFDNYKKRTAREKEALYSDAFCNAVSAFIPVVDNVERALQAFGKEENQNLREGVEMVFRQFKEVMKNLGVEEIKSVGEKFDPQLHNAVMHVEDDSCGESEVIEEFQKGYKLKDKIIRHSMVKVAN